MTVATDPRKTGVNAGMTLLAASAVAASVTGTLVETTLATVTIPAGSMGLNGGLLIYTTWSYTSSANSKTLRVRLGGIGGTAYGAQVVTTSVSIHDVRRIRNRGAINSQVGGSSPTGSIAAATSASGTAVVTSALDMSTAQDVVFSGQLALATETITLESYEVWLLP